MDFLASVGEEQGYNRLASAELKPFPYHLDANPSTITVETDTLDNIMHDFPGKTVHHVNLTINGAELQALDGISQVILENPKLRIYINSEAPDPFQAVVEKLQSLGFRIYPFRIRRTVNKRIVLMRLYAFL